MLRRHLVDRADFPLAQRIVPALVEPLLLLVPVNVEIIFEQTDPGIDQHPLEYRRVFEEGPDLRLGTEAHDPFDAGPVVPGAVEQNELGGGRKMLDIALEMPFGPLPAGRRGERYDPRVARA